MARAQSEGRGSRVLRSVLVAGLAWLLAHPCSCSPSPSDAGPLHLDLADAEHIRLGDRTFDVPALNSHRLAQSPLAQAVRDYVKQDPDPQTVPRCILRVPHPDAVQARSLFAVLVCCGRQRIEDVEVAGMGLHLPLSAGPTYEESQSLRQRAERCPPLSIHTEADLAALAEREEQLKDQPMGVRAAAETPLSLVLAAVKALQQRGAQVRFGLSYSGNSKQEVPVIIEVAPRTQGLYGAPRRHSIRRRKQVPPRQRE